MTEPGIYRNLPFAEYQAIDAWNPSLVLHMRESALAVDWFRHHPKPETTGMRLGTMIHMAVLEPYLFQKLVVVWPDSKRGKAYNDFCDENEGKTIITQAEHDTCMAIYDSVYEHPVASKHLGGFGEVEISFVWNDHHTGLLCKTRIDRLIHDTIIDLKTTTSSIANDYALRRIATTFGYHIAAAARQDAVSTLTGEAPDCKIIWAEQRPPHDVRVHAINYAVLSQGQDEWYRLLGIIAECEASGIWSGCDSGESDMQVWMDQVEPITIDGVQI